jgi:hypothetical protein
MVIHDQNHIKRFQLMTTNICLEKGYTSFTQKKGLHFYNPLVELIGINQNPYELGFNKITNLFTSDFNFQSPIKLALWQRNGPR